MRKPPIFSLIEGLAYHGWHSSILIPMRNLTLNAVLSIAVVGLGFVQAFARITHNDPLRYWAFGTAASPLPDVFGSYLGHEPMSHLHYLNVIFVDGSERLVYLDRRNSYRAYSKWAHITRFGPYGAVICWLPVLNHTIAEAMMKRGLCNDGALAQLYDFDRKVKSFKLWKTKQNGDPIPRGELYGTCGD